MGTWGTGLYQNDVSEDIKGELIDTCRRGRTIEEATELLIREYAEEIKDEDDAPNFWFALADTQWRYGKLLPKVKEKALYHIENELKKETYNEFDKSDAKKRKKVIEKLRDELNSPMPPEKKISQYRLYKCEWKIGDTFAYPLDSEIWRENNFYGDYLIMQKVKEAEWWPGHIIPVVKMKITENKQIPKDVKEMESLKHIIFMRQQSRHKNNYMIALGSTSKKIIPKKLIYIGNYNVFKSPCDEAEVDFKDMYIFCRWKDLDERIINRIEKNALSDA